MAYDFRDYRVIQRGFGGAQFEDVISHADKIVLPYRPVAIVVWVGTNDIADGESVEEVLGDYREFVDLVHNDQPEVDILFLGIMPTPGRFECCEERGVAFNAAVQQITAKNPKLHYVDLPAAFHALGAPSGDRFVAMFEDSIHINHDGYAIWTSLVRPALEAVVEPNKPEWANAKAPRPGDQLLFDFGPSRGHFGARAASPDQRGNHWNNWAESASDSRVIAGEHVGDLVNTRGEPTGVRLTITGGFHFGGKRATDGGSIDLKGAGDLGGAAAANDYFVSTGDKKNFQSSDDSGGGFVLGGLDPSLAYDFTILGAAASEAAESTEYRLTGASSRAAVLETSGNQAAQINGVRPDRFGQVFFDMTLIEGKGAYLNAMEVRVREP